MKLRPIMLAGTGSDVGKSVLAAALCRILLQEGYHPAPFKAQNMALNSAATPDGYEIGRAQMVQAEAARVPACTDMNPLLLKPNSDHTSQVVLNGKPIGNQDAYDYFNHPSYRQEVCQAFDRLAARYNPIVMEGAGSISELNLQEHDIVNMPMARYADARVLLVADIERGGVFASCYGSIMLQSPEDRALICGILVNKFRGDIRLFESGRRMLEEVCGVPVLGVIPYFRGIHIEEEDSLSRKNHRASADGKRGQISIAVVMFRHISNFTDFDRLEYDPRVNLFYTNNPKDLEQADIILLPGTKSTLADLYEIRTNGMAEAICQAHRAGKRIIGICGGYQMMGLAVEDPQGVEGGIPRLPGLGLLSVQTIMTQEKVTQQTNFDFQGSPCKGYEIHMGETRTQDGREAPQLCWEGENTMGTYLHGFFDNPATIQWLLAPYTQTETPQEELMDYADYRDRQFDLLAAHIRANMDIPRLLEIMKR